MRKTAFMVMPFRDDTATDCYRESTKPICEELGLEVRRADEIFTTNPIIDDIYFEIKQAKVVIVDVSGNNPNVFYELGMAHAIKREYTITITHNDYEQLPFDIKHFRAIKYEDSIKGKNKYEEELRLTLKSILKDYAYFFSEEFELIEEIFESLDDQTSLLPLLALGKTRKPVNPEIGPLVVEGRIPGFDRTVMSSATKLIGFNKFLKLGFCEKKGATLVLTEKGNAFLGFLENKGYVIDRFNEEIFTEGFIRFENRRSP